MNFYAKLQLSFAQVATLSTGQRAELAVSIRDVAGADRGEPTDYTLSGRTR